MPSTVQEAKKPQPKTPSKTCFSGVDGSKMNSTYIVIAEYLLLVRPSFLQIV